jgi:HEAT repeat protein
MRRIPLLSAAALMFVPLALGAADGSFPPLPTIPELFASAIDLEAPPRVRRNAREALVRLGPRAAEHLRGQMRAQSFGPRGVALRLLGRIGLAEDLPLLLQGLGAADPLQRRDAGAAVAAYLRDRPLEKQLIWLAYGRRRPLRDNLPAAAASRARAAALAAVAETCRRQGLALDAEASGAVRELLTAESAPERAAACAALGMTARPREAVEPLAERLGTDPDPGVRAAAARALGRLQPLDVSALETALEDSTPAVRLEAAAGLVRCGRDDLLARLAAALEPAAGESAGRSAAEAAALLEEDGPAAGEAAPLRLGGPGQAQRLHAVSLLAELAHPYSEAALAGALGDPAWRVRAAAAEALRRLPGSGITAALRPALEDPHPAVRQAAALTLADQGALGLQWRFVTLLEEGRTPALRAAAAETLGRLGAAETTDALAAALNDKDLAVALAAVAALGDLPADDGAVGAILEGALRDPRPAVRVAAARALEARTGEAWVAAALRGRAPRAGQAVSPAP